MMKCDAIGIAAAVLFLSSNSVLGHDAEPPVEANPVSAEMRYCLTAGVRAAWGAQARFLGAPAVFRYIPEAQLRQMFVGEITGIPTDAIYVLEDLDLAQRREYEELAFYGWKQADRWVREGRTRMAYELLSAVFYDGCKRTLRANATERLDAQRESEAGMERPDAN
jgi:hypothetical protein